MGTYNQDYDGDHGDDGPLMAAVVLNDDHGNDVNGFNDDDDDHCLHLLDLHHSLPGPSHPQVFTNERVRFCVQAEVLSNQFCRILIWPAVNRLPSSSPSLLLRSESGFEMLDYTAHRSCIYLNERIRPYSHAKLTCGMSVVVSDSELRASMRKKPVESVRCQW